MIQESELGKRIKEYRMKKGLTLQKLEEKTGFTKGYLSKVENTKKAPPVSTLVVLAKALEVSLSEGNLSPLDATPHPRFVLQEDRRDDAIDGESVR